jgi:ribosomal protein S9
MANKTVTKRTLDIVDLIRDRKLFPLLDVPPMRIKVVIEVTTTALIGTPKPAPEAAMKRLEAVARATLDHYEDTITTECEKFSKKIDELLEQGKLKEATAMAETVNHAVKNALLTAEGAATKAVEEARKAEGQKDKLLKEAQVKTVMTYTFAGVKIATHAVKLAGSHGADVTAYIGIAKAVMEIAMEIKQQLKTEEQLRKDLQDGIAAYLELRKTKLMEAAKNQGLTDTGSLPGFPEVIKVMAERILKTGKEAVKGKNAGQIATDIKDLVVKGITAKYNDVEKARKAYRENTTKMRQHVDKVSAQADKLFAEMKKATTLKEGVKIGAACMQAKGKVTRLAQALDASNKFLDESQATMKDMGLECNDQTILQKIAQVDIKTILTEGAGLLQNVKDIYDLVSAIAG